MKEFKKQDRYVSLFTKLFGTLVLIGIVPLVVMGISIYNVYLNSLKETLLSNMYRTTRSIGRNVEDLFSEMSENTKYLYTHQVEDYGYLYEILENEELSENKKKAAITDMLRDILYMNQHIEDVIFILPDGRIYTVMRPRKRWQIQTKFWLGIEKTFSRILKICRYCHHICRIIMQEVRNRLFRLQEIL